jgi:hypothetical protein
MTVEEAYLLLVYLIALLMMVWHYYDEAHFDSVSYFIDVTHEKAMKRIRDNDPDYFQPWDAYAVWASTRGPFLWRIKA